MDRSKTGIAGLDHIIGSGLIPGRLYLIDGDPGAGKTTLALQFLLEGVRSGERCLYVTLSETREELASGPRADH
jgi:circadian clock protein KaiC